MRRTGIHFNVRCLAKLSWLHAARLRRVSNKAEPSGSATLRRAGRQARRAGGVRTGFRAAVRPWSGSALLGVSIPRAGPWPSQRIPSMAWQRVRVHETEASYPSPVVPKARLGLACSGTSVGEDRAVPRETRDTESADEQAVASATNLDHICARPIGPAARGRALRVETISCMQFRPLEGCTAKRSTRIGKRSEQHPFYPRTPAGSLAVGARACKPLAERVHGLGGKRP